MLPVIYIRSTHLQRQAAGMLCGDAMVLLLCVVAAPHVPVGGGHIRHAAVAKAPLYIAVHFVNVPCATGCPLSSHPGIHEVWFVTQARISLLVAWVAGRKWSSLATDAWFCLCE
jgi:hypothetical protein